MAYVDKELQKRTRNAWYTRNKESRRTARKNNKDRIRNWLKEYKETLVCNRCGCTDSRCLVFHHKKDKTHNIADMIRNAHSIPHILEEIKKCEILCANCHAIEHYNDYAQVA